MMKKTRVLRGTLLLLLAAVVLPLAQCTPVEAGDDEGGGESGSGGGPSPENGGTGAGSSATSGGTGAGGGDAAGMSSGNAPGAGGSDAASCETPRPVTVGIALSAPVDQATFDAKWPALVCSALNPCCASKGTAYDEAKCLAHAATYFDKTKSYDPNEGGRCIQSLELAAESCAGDLAYRGIPGACTVAYRGDAPLGGACEVTGDCAPDPQGFVKCEHSQLAGGSVCHVDIRGMLGDPCHLGCQLATDYGLCHVGRDEEDPEFDPSVVVTCYAEDGLMCDYYDGCVPTLGLGCPCLLSLADCNPLHHCDGEGGDTVCQPRGGAGTPCTGNQNCTVDHYCPRDEEPASCRPRKHASEPCVENDECIGGFCILSACNLDNGQIRAAFDDVFCDGLGT